MQKQTTLQLIERIQQYVKQVRRQMWFYLTKGKFSPAKKWKHFLRENKIQIRLSSKRNPQSNPVEWQIGEILRHLRSRIYSCHTNWCGEITYIEYLWWITINSSIGNAPCVLQTGEVVPFITPIYIKHNLPMITLTDQQLVKNEAHIRQNKKLEKSQIQFIDKINIFLIS